MTLKTEVIKVRECDKDLGRKISSAADIIKNGGLVVFPTETVYGLGADATNSVAVKNIFVAKGRPSDNPLIIHIASPEDAEKYTYTNEIYYKLAKRFMPGPLTVILKSKDTIPLTTRAGLATVAVRCPENKIARSLISASGVPIAAPSANISGTPSATSATHVINDMMGRVDMIIDGGECDFGLESTIVKIEDDSSVTLLRPGKITVEELSEIVKNVNISSAVTNALREGEVALSPGMKYRHYAPTSPVELLDATPENAVAYIKSEGLCNIAVIVYDGDLAYFQRSLPYAKCYAFGEKNDEITQAHLLFSILRDADKMSFEKIYAPAPNKHGVGLALYNRMIRAAAHKITKL